jgi:hypothetical protein
MLEYMPRRKFVLYTTILKTVHRLDSFPVWKKEAGIEAQIVAHVE